MPLYASYPDFITSHRPPEQGSIQIYLLICHNIGQASGTVPCIPLTRLPGKTYVGDHTTIPVRERTNLPGSPAVAQYPHPIL